MCTAVILFSIRTLKSLECNKHLNKHLKYNPQIVVHNLFLEDELSISQLTFRTTFSHFLFIQDMTEDKYPVKLLAMFLNFITH